MENRDGKSMFLLTGVPGWLGNRFLETLQSGGIDELGISGRPDKIRCLIQPGLELPPDLRLDPDTEAVLVSRLFQLEQNKFYNAIVGGPAEDPSLLIYEIETTPPNSGNVKLHVLHSIPGQGPIDLYMGDTTQEKRFVTALEYLELTDPFQVNEIDIRVNMTATAHTDTFNPDSVLLSSDFNQIISGANYLSVVAPSSYDSTSSLTFWAPSWTRSSLSQA